MSRKLIPFMTHKPNVVLFLLNFSLYVRCVCTQTHAGVPCTCMWWRGGVLLYHSPHYKIHTFNLYCVPVCEPMCVQVPQ